MKNEQTPIKKPLVALVACPCDSRDIHNRGEVAFDNLELGYLYAALSENGYPVFLSDSIQGTNVFSSSIDWIVEKTVAVRPRFAVFSDSIPVFNQSLKLSQALKKNLPDLTVIYCGLHASLYYGDILKNEVHVDFIICGDVEFSLLTLIEDIDNNIDLSGIPGLAWRAPDQIRLNPPDFYPDLDRLPMPYRASLIPSKPDPAHYYNIISSRGCPGHCTYCVSSAYLNTYCPGRELRWRCRSPRHVFDEIQNLYEKGIRRFMFMDDNWVGPREKGLDRVIDLCGLMIDNRLSDISFSALIRPDSLLTSDRKALRIMKKAGLTALSMGLEAADQDQLKRFGKRVDLDQVRDLVALLFHMRIMVRCGFIMFYPYSTFDTLRTNGRYLDEIGASYFFYSFCNDLSALSAIPIEKKLLKDNLVARPTTYLSTGAYRYCDERMGALQKFLFSTMMRERDTIDSILIAGAEASRVVDKRPDCFRILQGILKSVGKANLDLFEFSLNTFESCPDPAEASGKCYLYSQNWSKLMEKENRNLAVLSKEISTLSPTFRKSDSN